MIRSPFTTRNGRLAALVPGRRAVALPPAQAAGTPDRRSRVPGCDPAALPGLALQSHRGARN
jgi:hypothetical protein